MKEIFLILIIITIKKLIYTETITKTVTPIEIESGEYIHLTQYNNGYMLIFHSSNIIYKYVYDTDGILKNTSTYINHINIGMNFQSINKDNNFVISNNPLIIFKNANNDCSTLNGDIGEHGIRLV